VAGAARIEPAPPPRGARRERLDRLCALALAACERALDDAGLAPRARDGARAGAVLGSAFGCHATNEAFYRGLLEEGPRAASPRLFAYTLPSAPLGELTIRLGVRGPAECFASGRQAGLEAVARAARLCEAGRADRVLAVAVEVGGGALPGVEGALLDGAAALVVEREEALAARGGRARARILDGASGFQADPAALDPGSERLAPEGEGAVVPVAALVDWLGSERPGGARAIVEAGDRGGGAATLLVERR